MSSVTPYVNMMSSRSVYPGTAICPPGSILPFPGFDTEGSLGLISATSNEGLRFCHAGSNIANVNPQAISFRFMGPPHPTSVLCRHLLHLIDHDNLSGTFATREVQSELLLQRRENRGA